MFLCVWTTSWTFAARFIYIIFNLHGNLILIRLSRYELETNSGRVCLRAPLHHQTSSTADFAFSFPISHCIDVINIVSSDAFWSKGIHVVFRACLLGNPMTVCGIFFGLPHFFIVGSITIFEIDSVVCSSWLSFWFGSTTITILTIRKICSPIVH